MINTTIGSGPFKPALRFDIEGMAKLWVNEHRYAEYKDEDEAAKHSYDVSQQIIYAITQTLYKYGFTIKSS